MFGVKHSHLLLNLLKRRAVTPRLEIQKLARLPFTRYCRYQHCMVYGMHKGGWGGVVYSALDVQ